MKHCFVLVGSLFVSTIATAQNSDPWPTTGNVGIGTTTPQASLHIKNTTPGAKLITLAEATYSSSIVQDAYNLTIESSANFLINFGNYSNRNTFFLQNAPNGARFWLTSNNGAYVNGYQGFRVGFSEKFGFFTAMNTTPYNAIGAVFTNNDNCGLNFFTKNAGTEMEAMRIASNGNIGIGTTTPEAMLHIKSPSTGTALLKLSDGIYSSTLMQNTYNTTLDAAAGFILNSGSGTVRNQFIMGGSNGGKFQLTPTFGAFVNGYSGFKIGHQEKYGFYTNGSTGFYYAIGTAWINNDNAGLSFFSRNAGTETETMRLTNTGRLGIGTISPEATLHVNGSIKFDGLTSDDTKETILVTDANGNVYTRAASTLGGNSTDAWILDGLAVGAEKKFGTTDNFDLPLITNNIEAMRITSTGNIGIGTATPQAKLAVNGDVFAKKVKVTASGWPAWPDYVFDESYKLPSLTEVEAFIKKNKHLPEVPSAKDVEADGLDLGNNQAVLLKKIEELTLYLIEQEKRMEKMEKELNMLRHQHNPTGN